MSNLVGTCWGLGFFFLHVLLLSPQVFPEYKSIWGGRGLVCRQLRSPALEPQLPSGEARLPQEPAPTWAGVPSGGGADTHTSFLLLVCQVPSFSFKGD